MGMLTSESRSFTFTCPRCRQVRHRVTEAMVRAEGGVSDVQVTGKLETVTLPDGRTVTTRASKMVRTPLCCSASCAKLIATRIESNTHQHTLANEDATRAVELAQANRTPPQPGRVGEPSGDTYVPCARGGCRTRQPVPRGRSTDEARLELSRYGWVGAGPFLFCSVTCRDLFASDPTRAQRLRTAEQQIAKERSAPAPARGPRVPSYLDPLNASNHSGGRWPGESVAERRYIEMHGHAPGEGPPAPSAATSTPDPTFRRPRSRRGA
jgi:hypothetical protein